MVRLTLDELLYFSGSVLGPALIAGEVKRQLERIPQLAGSPASSRPKRTADEILAAVFENDEAAPA